MTAKAKAKDLISKMEEQGLCYPKTCSPQKKQNKLNTIEC